MPGACAAVRTRLVHAVRVLRKDLEKSMSPYLSQPQDCHRYMGRWRVLDNVLSLFEDRPTNFDSRFTKGLAEMIHEVEPTPTLSISGKDLFELKPNGYPSIILQNFGPHELAIEMGNAYKRKACSSHFHDEVEDLWGSDGCVDPDLICSELSVFFNDLAILLRRHEDDQAMYTKRRDEYFEEDYKLRAKSRSFSRDKYIYEVFSRKRCLYCFRLIPERKGGTKSSIGKTCSLHDPIEKPAIYKAARERHGSLIEKKHGIGVGVDNPSQILVQIQAHMDLFLSCVSNSEIFGDQLFDLAFGIFSTDKSEVVDSELLEMFLDLVIADFPEIARPFIFAERVRKVMKLQLLTPQVLLPMFGWFVYDVNLPLHPKIIGFYLRLFYEESWFAQVHCPDYYEPNAKKGRIPKINPVEVYVEWVRFTEDNSGKERKAVASLAEKFSCTTQRVRQILKSYNKLRKGNQ